MTWIVWLAACHVDSTSFVRSKTIPDVSLEEASPPPAPGPSGEKLFQVLYAGETGEAAFAAGQRVRVRAWLDVMAFSAAELDGLRALVRDVRALVEEDRRARARLDGLELAAFSPIYAELDARLAAEGPLSEDEAAAFAARLETARAAVYGEEDPHVAQVARVRKLLNLTTPWIDGLPADKRDRLHLCRFFLAKESNPILNPADYQAIVGMDWDGGDFTALAATEAPKDQSHMDVGGLWSVEHLRAPPGAYLQHRQLQAIVVMAVTQPALGEVLGVSDVVAAE
ncbi:MAG: hypothetical protein ACOZNI_33265 [Myxococcota bacterium]